MYRANRFSAAIALLAVATWLAPVRSAHSEEKTAVAADVALDQSGALRGMVVDAQAPCADHLVIVQQTGRVVSQSRTQADGRFEVAGLRGGAYLVSCNDAGIPCRLWSAQAAPPAANQELLLPANLAVARGQNRFRTLVRTVVIVTAVSAAIAIPLVLTLQEDERQNGS